MNLAERPETGHIMNLFRVLTLAGAWVMSAFPSVSTSPPSRLPRDLQALLPRVSCSHY